MRYRTDKQLVSHNEQNASYNYKYTFSTEIVPICKVGVLPVQRGFIMCVSPKPNFNSAVGLCLCQVCYHQNHAPNQG